MYQAIIPEPEYTQELLSKGSEPLDTVVHMDRIARENAWQVSELAEELRADTVSETCENIWYWIRANVRYINEKGEELRTPARTIHEGKGDCDCMSILASAILLECEIDHAFRIASYSRATPTEFEHVYVVAKDEQGQEVIIDCVPEIKVFNQEHTPLINYHDHDMSTYQLNGLGRIGSVVGIDLNPTPDRESTEYGLSTLQGFLQYIRIQLNALTQSDITEKEKEYAILSMIETPLVQQDYAGVGKGMTYAIENSKFAEAYIAMNKVLMVTLPAEGSLGFLKLGPANLINSVGDAFSKVAVGVDLIGGGVRKRAAEQNEANNKLADKNLEAERLRVEQARLQSEAMIAQANAQAISSQNQAQQGTNKSGKEGEGDDKGGFIETLKNYWWAFAIGLVAIIVGIYFLTKGKAKTVKGIRRRKTVKGIGKVGKAPRRRKASAPAPAPRRRATPKPKTKKRKAGKVKGTRKRKK